VRVPSPAIWRVVRPARDRRLAVVVGLSACDEPSQGELGSECATVTAARKEASPPTAPGQSLRPALDPP